MKLDPKDRPVVLAFLAIPLALFLTLATLNILPPDPPNQHQTKTDPNKSSGEKTSVANWFLSWKAEDYIAAFTLATLAAIALQLIAMRRANDHFKVTERAYVKMSHRPPGVRWEGVTGGKFTVTVRVRNHGRTPAEITDAIIIHEVHDRATIIPEHPDYGTPRHKIPATFFLVSDDEFDFTEDFEVSRAERDEIDSGTKVLTILGYVDYIDKFDQRYRGGYARAYRPPTANEALESGFSGTVSTQPNLALFPNRKRNYDRLRVPSEGNDWDA